jgi:hypothetical protein
VREEEELRTALGAELDLLTNDGVAVLRAALEAEVANRVELERELEQARQGAAVVQGHHEEVIERNRKQFELAANRQRLRVLHEALEAIPLKKKPVESEDG